MNKNKLIVYLFLIGIIAILVLAKASCKKALPTPTPQPLTLTPQPTIPKPTAGAEEPVNIPEAARKAQTEKYPLVPFTPPSTANFSFRYTGPLEITVYYKGDLEDVQSEAFEWIENQGVNPASHQINWVPAS